MSNEFFEKPILNPPYEYPPRYWEHNRPNMPKQGRGKAANFNPLLVT